MPQHKGRGALSNQPSRYLAVQRIADWPADTDPRTTVTADPARRVISYNRSPDVPFDRSINPYRGCEHGCIYCYARPSHAWLDLSPGLDFETRLFAKHDAPALLERELRHPRYRCAPVGLGANTDPYQPIERRYRITRGILEVLDAFNHPVMIVSKGSLMLRDLDLLAGMARRRLISVAVSLTSLDPAIKRSLEPRAASPQARLRLIRELSGAGVPVTALIAPVIPAVTDSELEELVAVAADAGAVSAGYVLLRLPHEVAGLFREWLERHYPDRADHVISLIRQSRGGRDNDPAFGRRMRGTGLFAELIAQRFRLACRRHGLDRKRPPLDSAAFRPPPRPGDQMVLV
jgi:DNA repair photolyase